MSDVFISYSRKDIAFARMLHSALKENGFETWIDWQDIPPSADWLAEVYEAIEQADSFIFIISPISVASEICGLEIAHAAKNNKRLIPIVIDDIDPQIVPPSLTHLNWILFKEEDKAFQSAVADLITAIGIDQAWVKEHTRLQTRALEWERKENDRGLLLRGSDLSDGESWLAQATEKDPQPTALQTRFLLASRQDATRRQRITMGAIFAGMVVAIALSILAWTQRNLAVSEGYVRATAQANAEEAQATAVSEADARATEVIVRQTAQAEAETQRDISISRELAVHSTNQLNNNWELSLLLAIEANLNSDTLEAAFALREARFHLGRTTMLITGHTEVVSHVVWHPLGHHLLTVGEDGARIWDAATGDELILLDTDSKAVLWADWSPDGNRVVTTSIQGASVWNIAATLQGNEEEPKAIQLSGHSDVAVFAAWSPDGTRLVTTSLDGSARVWDAESGHEISVFNGHEQAVKHSAWSPDGVYIVSSDGEFARIWLAETGIELVVLPGYFDVGSFATWNTDGTRLVTTGIGYAQVWDVSQLSIENGADFQPITLTRHSHFVPAMAVGSLEHASWSPNGSRILSVSQNGTAEIWDVENDQTLALSGHTDAVYRCMWDPPGLRVVTAGADGARVWDTETGEQISILSGAADAILDAAWNPSGTRIATAGADGDVRIWTVTGVEEEMAFNASVQERTFWDPSGKTLATSGYGTFLWDSLSGEELASIGGDFAAWDPDGDRLLVAMPEGEVRIWETKLISQGEMEELSIELIGHTDEVLHTSWNLSGSHIATVSKDNSVRLWDAESGEGWVLVQMEEETPMYSEWNQDDALLIVSPQGVYVWHAPIDEQEPDLVLNENEDEISHAAWSPDGTLILSTVDERVYIWNAQDGQLVFELEGHTGPVSFAAWSPAGKQLVTASRDNTLRIWDAEDGRLQSILSGHTGPTDFAAWDPTGTLILSASGDGTARLWDVSTGKTLVVISGYFDSIRHVAWSPDGMQFVTTSWGGPVRVFALPEGGTLDTACALAVRNMAPEEWERYFPGQPYRKTCPHLP